MGSEMCIRDSGCSEGMAAVQASHREAMAMMVERVDAAKVMAEQTNAMLYDLVSWIMALPTPVYESTGSALKNLESTAWGWLGRLFGTSRRSSINNKGRTE